MVLLKFSNLIKWNNWEAKYIWYILLKGQATLFHKVYHSFAWENEILITVFGKHFLLAVVCIWSTDSYRYFFNFCALNGHTTYYRFCREYNLFFKYFPLSLRKEENLLWEKLIICHSLQSCLSERWVWGEPNLLSLIGKFLKKNST